MTITKYGVAALVTLATTTASAQMMDRTQTPNAENEGIAKSLEQQVGGASTSCHVESLTIDHDRRVADVDTRYDPDRGIFNNLFATATGLTLATTDDPALPARLDPAGGSFAVENLNADLKRHDLGLKFHERNFAGTLQKEFMTGASARRRPTATTAALFVDPSDPE
jgi:hypothetical protein